MSLGTSKSARVCRCKRNGYLLTRMFFFASNVVSCPTHLSHTLSLSLVSCLLSLFCLHLINENRLTPQIARCGRQSATIRDKAWHLDKVSMVGWRSSSFIFPPHRSSQLAKKNDMKDTTIWPRIRVQRTKKSNSAILAPRVFFFFKLSSAKLSSFLLLLLFLFPTWHILWTGGCNLQCERGRPSFNLWISTNGLAIIVYGAIYCTREERMRFFGSLFWLRPFFFCFSLLSSLRHTLTNSLTHSVASVREKLLLLLLLLLTPPHSSSLLSRLSSLFSLLSSLSSSGRCSIMWRPLSFNLH